MFPYSTTDHPLESSLLKKQSFQLYNQIQNPDSPFFSNFPCPFFDEHDLPLNQIIFPHHSPPSDQITQKPAEDPISNCHVPPRGRRNLGGAPRKRTGKKDRHSKICTAQGVRDRRMRLSLQVARKFFDLQDMLGYDKASKTIEWLFCKSKDAIKDLANDISDAKSESECDQVVSGIEESSNINIDIHEMVVQAKGINGTISRNHRRNAREKARARARCRTREKMMIKLGQELGVCAGAYSPDVGTIEKLLQGNSSTYHCSDPTNNFMGFLGPTNNFMGFLGNWDHVLNNDRFQLAVANQVSHPGNSTSMIDFPFFHQHH